MEGQLKIDYKLCNWVGGQLVVVLNLRQKKIKKKFKKKIFCEEKEEGLYFNCVETGWQLGNNKKH